MLQTERLGRDANDNQTVAIRVSKRSSIFDRPLLQALTWSFIAHLVLFGTFRIRFMDLHEPTVSMNPIAVAIDPEEGSEAIGAVTSVNDTDSVDKRALFTSAIDPAEWQQTCLNRLSTLSDSSSKLLGTHTSAQTGPSDISPKELKESLPKVHYSPRVYPLQLKLSHSLRKLDLLEDGSSLFRKTEPYDDTGHIYFSKQHYQIEYNVEVDGMSGLILYCERKHVLLDKELQAIADLLIKKIRFAPFQEKSLKGSLSITFCLSGEEVMRMLDHD